MKITVIEMSHDEAMGLFLTMKNEEPEITEIHEDFEEAIHEPPKPEKKPKAEKNSPLPPSKRGKGGRPKSRPVYLKDGDGWKSFPTPKDAAEYIGCERQKVYDALSKGVKCQGYEVSYSFQDLLKKEQDLKREEEDILPRHGG